ncbi:MAG: helix-turn-helix domain-containing protein [Terriglobales bacterium]
MGCGLNSIMERILFSIADAAKSLGLSRRSVERLIFTGKLPRRKIGDRTPIPCAALREFARRDQPVIGAAPEVQ